MRATFANIGMPLLLPALLLAGCGRAPEAPSPAEADGAASVPDVAVTAAPGVAFTYAYAFALPAERLSAAQEAHAAACEALGVARCRVTGFRYRVDGTDSASGRLEMRLAPAIARRFGQKGVKTVQRAGGRLTEATAQGTDAAADLERLAAEQASAAAGASAADARARAAGGDGFRRDEQLAARDQARSREAAARASAADQRRALASTPVTFDYASGAGLPVFDTAAPLASAGTAALASAKATLAVVLGGLALLGPPALALLAGLLLVRRLAPVWRRWFPAPAPSA